MLNCLSVVLAAYGLVAESFYLLHTIYYIKC